jgi:hypothetical protein
LAFGTRRPSFVRKKGSATCAQSQRIDIVEFAHAEIVAMVALLRAYIDEFGDYKDRACQVFGMIGMVGTVHSWHKLQSKWEDALECCGVTRFHGTDLQAFTLDYEGWTSFQRERLTSLLVRVVEEDMHNFRMVGSATILADYAVLPMYRKKFTRNPYYMSAVTAMQEATWKADEEFNGKPVEFIFDQRKKQVRLLNDAYDEVLATSTGHLCAGITRADHRKVSPLQVADLAAYESKKFLERKLIDGIQSQSDLRWPLFKLKQMFRESEASLLNLHGLWLITDFWGNYERADQLLNPNRPVRNKWRPRNGPH